MSAGGHAGIPVEIGRAPVRTELALGRFLLVDRPVLNLRVLRIDVSLDHFRSVWTMDPLRRKRMES